MVDSSGMKARRTPFQSAGEPDGRSAHPRFRAIRRTALLLLALAAAATFPRGWGAALAGRVARSYLDLGEPGSSRCTVRWISPFRLDVRDVSLGAAPGTPSLGCLEARFTPWGLARGRVGSLEATGLSAVFTNELAAAGDLVADATAGADLHLRWVEGRGYEGFLEGTVFGGPLEARIGSDAALSELRSDLRFEPALRGLALPALTASFRVMPSPAAGTSLAASANAGFEGSSWQVRGTCVAGTNGAFAADAALPDATLARDDPLVAPLLAWSGATNALRALSGSVTGAVHVAKAADAPVAEWNAALRVSGLDADLEAGETPVELRGGGTLLRVAGYGGKFFVRPFGIRYRSVRAGRGLSLDAGSFWFRADDLSSLLLTEGRTGFCGGTVRVYALHLDLEHLDAGFTLYLDDLEAGEILAALPGVEGTATGTIHGKIPLSYRDGKVLLRDAYLYSPPGQVGKLRLSETDAVVENLRAAGVPDSTCDDLRTALADLDYTVLRMDLRQNRDATGRLDVRLEGTAGEGKAAIPVSLELGFNGQLQDLLNVGIRASTLGTGGL